MCDVMLILECTGTMDECPDVFKLSHDISITVSVYVCHSVSVDESL